MTTLGSDRVEAKDLVAGIVANRRIGDTADGEVLHGSGEGGIVGLQGSWRQRPEIAPRGPRGVVVGERSGQVGEVTAGP